MSGSDPADTTSSGGWLEAVRSHLACWRLRVAHWLKVTIAWESDPNSESIRAGTLACIVGILFAVLGTVQQFAVADFFADSPITFDLSLRALSLGWFDPDRTIPVTIVDIDEETNRDWGSPPITPRDQITRMLEIVVSAHPAAVVVDIDLSWGDEANGGADAGLRVLHDFLQRYAGPAPLIFPKRIEPARDGTHRMAASPVDEVFETNSRLAWAHASFETGSGGAVRNWHDWLGVCTKSGPAWLPSVATTLAAMMSPLPKGLERPSPPPQAHSCKSDADPGGRSQRLLIGPRVTGDRRSGSRADAQAISASLLLDPQIARDDAGLFGGRVVLIGATHASSGDFWLTPSGVLPGVELLANTVRFATLQAHAKARAGQVAYRCAALLLFALFVLAEWHMRGLVALFVSTLCMLLLVVVALGFFADFGVFDSVETAILLFIPYKFLGTVLDFIDDFRAKRRRSASGFWGTLRAACVREHKPRPQGD